MHDSELSDSATAAASLQNLQVILKDTSHPGNIGAAARAMKTMGLTRLSIAAPQTLIDTNARAMAVGALDVLGDAAVCETLPAALSGCSRVFAFSARNRDIGPSLLHVREAAALAAKHCAAGAKAAFVFGGERSGLTNEDMRLAHYAVLIPSSREYWSLNLSQAVQIAAYEFRLATFALHHSAALPQKPRPMPSHEELARLFVHGREFLADIGMPKRGDGTLLGARLQRLLMRARPDLSEVKMLRGILTAARKKMPPH